MENIFFWNFKKKNLIDSLHCDIMSGERTFLIVKPDGVQRGLVCLSTFEFIFVCWSYLTFFLSSDWWNHLKMGKERIQIGCHEIPHCFTIRCWRTLCWTQRKTILQRSCLFSYFRTHCHNGLGRKRCHCYIKSYDWCHKPTLISSRNC